MTQIVELPVPEADWRFNTLRAYVLQAVEAVANESRFAILDINHKLDLRDRLYGERQEFIKSAGALALDAQRQLVSAAFAASEEAIKKADQSNEKRFESVNEFRKTLTDQTATFMPRAQIEALFANLNEKLESVRDDMKDFVARTEIDQGNKSFTQQLTSLQTRMDIRDGKETGSDKTTESVKSNANLMIGCTSALIALIGILAAIFAAKGH